MSPSRSCFTIAWIERWSAWPYFRPAVGALSATCLLPVLLTSVSSPLVLTIGLTSLYMGYAGVLLLALLGEARPSPAGGNAWLSRGLAFVGHNSYSIYVWHIAALDWIIVPLLPQSVRLWEVGFWPIGLIYLVVSLGLGIAMARLIEVPALRLRDRWFPSRTVTPIPLGAAA